MSTVFIIGGLDIHNTAADSVHKPLRHALGANGHQVIPVDISWRNKTASQFSLEFIDFYNRTKSSKENVVVGNSFGAVVALISAAALKPDQIVLCSLSPFFAEDIHQSWPSKRMQRLLGTRRLEDIGHYSIEAIAEDLNKTNIEVTVLYGEKEHQSSPKLVERAKDIAEKIKRATLVEVEAAPHSLKSPEYVRGLTKIL